MFLHQLALGELLLLLPSAEDKWRLVGRLYLPLNKKQPHWPLSSVVY